MTIHTCNFDIKMFPKFEFQKYLLRFTCLVSYYILSFLNHIISYITFLVSILPSHPSQAQCYKTFFVRNLRIFIISQSVCPRQVLLAQSNVCGNTRSLPQSGVSKRCFIRVGSCLIFKHQTRLERLARDKHSSLLRKPVNYRQKSFIILGPDVL